MLKMGIKIFLFFFIFDVRQIVKYLISYKFNKKEELELGTLTLLYTINWDDNFQASKKAATCNRACKIIYTKSVNNQQL